MKDKIRIAMVSTCRITDCNRDLIEIIDKECLLRKCSRVELIRQLSDKPLKDKNDIKKLQKWVKEQGFKTIERWLEYMFREELKK